MVTALVTGSGGLVGSECVRHYAEAGYRVVGLENDLRGWFFGEEASTAAVTRELMKRYDAFESLELDVRDSEAVSRVMGRLGPALEVIVHAAAQPSHDWATREPQLDFAINATGTLNVLEAARRHAPDATFIFTSTNRVYGDTPNRLPLRDEGTRLELPRDDPYYDGIDTTMAIDRSRHSLFGVSKVAADLLVQEYGRLFDMPTVCFRAGCVTGPAHAGTRLHGFLSYLMKCTVASEPYVVHGYGGKQVRDNISSRDLVAAFAAFEAAPSVAAVYNIGGGRDSNCSMLEAIDLCQRISGRELDWTLREPARTGDHRWWISDLCAFCADYPEWRLKTGLEEILREIHDANAERWRAGTRAAA